MTEKVKPKVEKVKRLEKKKNSMGELTDEATSIDDFTPTLL